MVFVMIAGAESLKKRKELKEKCANASLFY